jgi:pyruvate formate-lyase activating enzyme-like uncharacterized protein
VKKDFEEVNADGLLVKGVIVPDKSTKDLEKLRTELIDEFEIPENLISVDREKMRIETTREIAYVLSGELRYGCFIVEEYPTGDRLETDVVPLNRT